MGAATATRAIAETLERQVTAKLREGLVVWLDKDGLYTDFVDRLAERRQQGNFYAPVVSWRGSYLELLMALEGHLDGLDPEPLLLHLPGHNESTIRTTPLLEAYHTGKVFKKALPTLIRDAASGLVSAAEVDRFAKTSDLTLAQAEEWLASQLATERSGLAAALHHRKPEGVFEELLSGSLEVRPDEVADLEAYLETQTGMDNAFVAFFHPPGAPKTWHTLLETLVGWLMCVEYVNDLSRAPVQAELQPLKKLSAHLTRTCQTLLKQLRKRHPDRYCHLAIQTESLIAAELEAGSPEELGKIDTFSREDSRLLEASVTALNSEAWSQALDWAQVRLNGSSVWLETDPLRRQEWQVVAALATLGQAVSNSARPLQGVNSLAEAVERYTAPTGAHAVDQAHRHFEQERLRLLDHRMRHYESLCAAAATVRLLYHRWADRLGEEFAEVCAAHGFLPEKTLQQRSLYEDVVHPLTQRGHGTVAYFTVDALRFEMAEELARRLTRPGVRLQLRARLAELPTITRVGMNVLSPIAVDGRLKVEGAFKTLRSREYAVSNRQSRLRAMGDRSLGALPGGRRNPLALSLRDISYMQPEELKKKIGKTPLVVVHSREIDSAGEADLGVANFDTSLGELYSAVNLLRNAGVDEFVITADHGFLLLDESLPPLELKGGTAVERRWRLTEAQEKHDALAGVSLVSLCYDHPQEPMEFPRYLQFPRSGQVFKTPGDLARSFAHGGSSLQERVIPVLTLSWGGRDLGGFGQYRLEANCKAPVLGHHRVELRLLADNQMLLGYESKVIPLALRAIDHPDAQVVCKQVSGAELQNQQLLVPVGPNWVEVIFTLEGGTASRVNLELYHPNGDERVTPCRLAEFFDVQVVLVDASPPESTSWEDAIQDVEHRRVFSHLFTYGSIDEDEMREMLGGKQSAVRRFSLRFEGYLALLPFEVGIDSTGTLKRYVKK